MPAENPTTVRLPKGWPKIIHRTAKSLNCKESVVINTSIIFGFKRARTYLKKLAP